MASVQQGVTARKIEKNLKPQKKDLKNVVHRTVKTDALPLLFDAKPPLVQLVRLAELVGDTASDLGRRERRSGGGGKVLGQKVLAAPARHVEGKGARTIQIC